MNNELCEKSINDLFMDPSNKCKYIIPIYQRNYAWGKNEISTLIQDIYYSFNKDKERNYYIGTLVTFNKGNNEYEIIDGQQRLTTIYLILNALKKLNNDVNIASELTYKSRKKSVETLKKLNNDNELNDNDKDNGIINGYKYVNDSYEDIVKDHKEDFNEYFKNKVIIVHYEVPKDVDLNNYFEIMNSRGEQLEKHEILKARLMGLLKDDKGEIDIKTVKRFGKIWDACSKMERYIQTTYEYKERIFNETEIVVNKDRFNEIYDIDFDNQFEEKNSSISDLVKNYSFKLDNNTENNNEENNEGYFQSIIDFPNFLLIVLKIYMCVEDNGNWRDVVLDDNDLLIAFDKNEWKTENVKKFGNYLLIAKYYLDNFFPHQLINGKERVNPWVLQKYKNYDKKGSYGYIGLSDNIDIENKLVQLLSMFQVTYNPMSRKNYLFYCLYYLIRNDINTSEKDVKKYLNFVENLAKNYLYLYYMQENEPKSFDSVILKDDGIFIEVNEKCKNAKDKFNKYYFNGENNENKRNIPLFIFNYLDYKLWDGYIFNKKLLSQILVDCDYKNYKNTNKNDRVIKEDDFKNFYFSATRNSLEHFFAQSRADGKSGNPNDIQINCLGNYAYIGSSANSSGSDWIPSAKVNHYLDSKNINQVSISSLKFKIMMQICKLNNGKWGWDQIKDHQDKVLSILFDDSI